MPLKSLRISPHVFIALTIGSAVRSMRFYLWIWVQFTLSHLDLGAISNVKMAGAQDDLA